MCKAGAGIEKTAGMGDTDGFRLRGLPEIVKDPRGFLRLCLNRTNSRIIQTSTYALQGKYQ